MRRSIKSFLTLSDWLTGSMKYTLSLCLMSIWQTPFGVISYNNWMWVWGHIEMDVLLNKLTLITWELCTLWERTQSHRRPPKDCECILEFCELVLLLCFWSVPCFLARKSLNLFARNQATIRLWECMYPIDMEEDQLLRCLRVFLAYKIESPNNFCRVVNSYLEWSFQPALKLNAKYSLNASKFWWIAKPWKQRYHHYFLSVSLEHEMESYYFQYYW